MAPLSRICRRLGIDHATVAICVTQLGSCLITTTFMFYYVKVYLNLYHVSEAWFQLAQVLFMIWNAVNDPLFGYCQDVGSSWMRDRKRSILYGGPVLALAFVLPWFGWVDGGAWTGLHLVVALFLYDGAFSFVLLSWCSVFAEATTEHAARVRCLKYMQLAILVGVNVIVVLEKASSSLQVYWVFQSGTVLIALIAGLTFWYTGMYAPSEVAQVRDLQPLVASEKQRGVESPWRTRWQVTRDIFASPDFHRITWTNFLQICRSTTHLNFAAIFTEGLLPRHLLPLGSWRLSAFYGACTLLPQILVVTCSGAIVRSGAHRLLVGSFVCSMAASSVAYLVASDWPLAVMLFMLVDSVCVHSFSPMMMILFSDFIDDDMVRHERSSPLSSIVFSLNALCTKPAQSLAPMLVVYLLNQSGYEAYKAKPSDGAEWEALRRSMFSLLCLTPLLLSTLQLLIFKPYRLRDKHLTKSVPILPASM